MNVKITKEQHEYLCSLPFKEYLFGSQLHGIATEDSDSDYIRIVDNSFYDNFNTKAKYLPNIHSWQFDDTDNNIQYVWLTERQFYHNLFSGDGNMLADVVLLSGDFPDALFLSFTYKVIKGYLGVAKRDLKMHGGEAKKRFHALRSMYMAECLLQGELPTIEGIRNLKNIDLPTKDELLEREAKNRLVLTDMLNNNLISLYPDFKEEEPLAQIMADCNNVKQFKY